MGCLFFRHGFSGISQSFEAVGHQMCNAFIMRFLFIFVAFVTSQALALQAGVVSLSVGTQYCTGTVVKTENGRCHLLTAAHCSDMSPIWKVLSLGSGEWARWIAAPAKGAVNLSLAIRRIDRDRDLAELEWSQSLNGLCSQLEPFSVRAAADLVHQNSSVALIGTLGPQVYAQTVDDGPWPAHAQPSLRQIYSYGGIDDLLIENVRGIRGFSGGAIVDFQGNLLGIFKKFVPRDDIILVATTQQIQEFIVQRNPPRPVNFCPQTLGRYSNGGGNSHANGGGESRGYTNGTAPDVFGGADPETMQHWETFLEPTEGILNPRTCGSTVLGKGNSRVDGPEDFERLMSLPGAWIERPLNGFPDEKIRKGILDRFLGTYVSKGKARTNSYSIHYGYIELAQAGLRQTSKIKLDIIKHGSSEYLIRMHQDQAATYSYKNPELGLKIPDSVAEIKARLSANTETVTLEQQLTTYTCRNENYLKLSCEGAGVLFSISKSSLNDSRLKLRYTRGVQTRLRDGKIYRFFIHMIDDLQRVQ